MSDPRSEIANALKGKLNEEQVSTLIDSVLAIKKKVRHEFTCTKDCKRRQIHHVEIDDTEKVVKALSDLLNQAWGRPTEVKEEAGTVVEYKVIITNPDTLVTVHDDLGNGYERGSEGQ